jgi:tetratricopeptide (TPR) repeat protein
VEIELRGILGQTYAGLREDEKSVAMASGALRLHQAITPVPTTTTASLHHRLARSLRVAGNLVGATDHFQHALTLNEKLLGPDSTEVFWGNLDLAIIHSTRNEFGETERRLRVAQANAVKRWGNDAVDPGIAKRGMEFGMVFLHLGILDKNLRRLDEAVANLERGLAHLKAGLGETNTDYIVWLGTYERLLRARGDYAAAGRTTRQALALARPVFGDDHPALAQLYEDLASQQRFETNLPGAIESAKAALRIYENAWGQTRAETLRARQLLTDLERPSVEKTR